MQRGEISTEYTCCHAARPIAELGAADPRAAASRAELGELAPAHTPHVIRASEAAWSVLPKLVLMRAPPPGCSLSPESYSFRCPCVQHTLVIEAISGGDRYGAKA